MQIVLLVNATKLDVADLTLSLAPVGTEGDHELAAESDGVPRMGSMAWLANQAAKHVCLVVVVR